MDKKNDKLGDAFKSTYTKEPLPDDVVKELENLIGVSSLRTLETKKFRSVLDNINMTVLNKYKENSKYSKFFKPGNNDEFIDAKSMKRYFSGSPIRQDKLFVILCFLNYPPERLAAEENVQQNITQNDSFNLLEGAWYSYVYDVSEPSYNKVKRTTLFIGRRNAYFLDVQYEGLPGRFNGTGEIFNNSLILNIQNREKTVRIYLCAELPEYTDTKINGELILNVHCLSNSKSGQPVTSNVIFVKNHEAIFNFDEPNSIEDYLKVKPATLLYSALNNQNEKIKKVTAEPNWKEREIILYLTRNKDRNKRLKAFSPNSFEHLASRNALADRKNGRENYERLKIKLINHVFYAFNRFRQNINEVAIFSYTFDFQDVEKKCIASRHPIGSPNKTDFLGEVYLLAEKLIFNLIDEIGLRRKQFIAPFNCVMDEESKTLVFKGITSTISSLNGNPMALRELIVCIPTPDNETKLNSGGHFSEDDMTNGYMSYQSFRELPDDILRSEEKLFLANQFMSALTFPTKTDTSFVYYRLDKARKYKGRYDLFTIDTDNTLLLHMELSIDSLSQVILKIKYSNEVGDKIYHYHGVCEFYNNSLRIGVHFSSDYPNDEKHAEFIFDPIIEKNRKLPVILTGKTLTTDDENKSSTVKFLAIRYEALNESDKSKLNQKKGDLKVELANIGVVCDIDVSLLNKLLNENGISNNELLKLRKK